MLPPMRTPARLGLCVLAMLLALPFAAFATRIFIYYAQVSKIVAQPLSADGAPSGPPVDVKFVQTVKSGGQLKHPPKGLVHPWLLVTVDVGGRSHPAHDHEHPSRGGASAEVTTEALQVVVNHRLELPPGEYRLTLDLRFQRGPYELF